MVAYSTIKDKKNQLIRKGLEGSVFIADSSVAAITLATLFDATTGALLALPVGYKDLGWTTEDGAQFSRSVDTSDTKSWGSTEPTRSDVNSDVTTMQVTAQETKLLTLGLYTGATVSATTTNTGGAVAIPKPAKPTQPYRRVLSIAVDQGDAGEIIIARFLPRAKVTDLAEQAHANNDTGITWGVTMTAYVDSTEGYSENYMFGGEGWKALLTDMGFTAGP